jgi:hypothetical protein
LPAAFRWERYVSVATTQGVLMGGWQVHTRPFVLENHSDTPLDFAWHDPADPRADISVQPVRGLSHRCHAGGGLMLRLAQEPSRLARARP